MKKISVKDNSITFHIRIPSDHSAGELGRSMTVTFSDDCIRDNKDSIAGIKSFLAEFYDVSEHNIETDDEVNYDNLCESLVDRRYELDCLKHEWSILNPKLKGYIAKSKYAKHIARLEELIKQDERAANELKARMAK